MSWAAPSPSPRRKGDKRERTRAALVAAAVEEVAEKGFDRMSLEAVARRAGMTRGAVYGNFKDREALLLAVTAASWTPVAPAFEAGASFRRQMQIFGEAVADEAERRRPRAAAMAAFQLHLFTHPALRERMSAQNGPAYEAFARALEGFIPAWEMPLPSAQLVRILDALTTGVMFTYFQTPDLISRDDMVAAFTALAARAES